MTRIDLTRPQVVDRFYYAYGFTVQGGPDAAPTGSGFCGLEWRPLPGGRLLVIAYEHPDNRGRSVTNAAEDIAQQFSQAAGVALADIVWVESYAVERPAEPPAFDRCTFTAAAGGTLRPAWRRMTAADWQALGIAPPTVPSLVRRPTGPPPTPQP